MKLFLVFIICTVLSAEANLAAEQKINLSATEWPPYYGKDLKNNGFITEIIRAVFRRVGYEVAVDFLPWKRALHDTKAGKYDGLFTVWYRKEREQWFVFSRALPPNEVVLFKRKDKNISFKNYQSLKPYRIGVVRGYATPPGFDEAKLKTSEVNSDELNLRKLHKDRIDLALTDKITGMHIIKKKMPEAADALEWMQPSLHIEIQHLVISKKAKNYQKKLQDFNRGLEQLEQDGTLKAILEAHGF